MRTTEDLKANHVSVWKLLCAASAPVNLEEVAAVEGVHFNRHGQRSVRIGINSRAWFQTIRRASTGSNDQAYLKGLLAALNNLLRYNATIIFVFEEEIRFIGSAFSIRFVTSLLGGYGFSTHRAAGSIDVELATLSRDGFLDLIVTPNAEVLAYGATLVLRNISSTVLYANHDLEARTGLSVGGLMLLCFVRDKSNIKKMTLEDKVKISAIGTRIRQVALKQSYRTELSAQLRRSFRELEAILTEPLSTAILPALRARVTGPSVHAFLAARGSLMLDASFWKPRAANALQLQTLVTKPLPLGKARVSRSLLGAQLDWHAIGKSILIRDLRRPSLKAAQVHIANDMATVTVDSSMLRLHYRNLDAPSIISFPVPCVILAYLYPKLTKGVCDSTNLELYTRVLGEARKPFSKDDWGYGTDGNDDDDDIQPILRPRDAKEERRRQLLWLWVDPDDSS